MGRGFLSGIFMGAIVSAILIFVSSQTLDRQALSFPKPDASTVEVPAGTEFDQARAETDPVLPNSETRPEAETVAEVPVPDDAPDAPPALDTSALEVPTPTVEAPDTLATVVDDQSEAPAAPGGEEDTQPGQVSVLTAPTAPAKAPDAETATPEVTLAPTEDAAPETGTEESAPQVDTEIAALPATGTDSGGLEDRQTAPAVASDDTSPSPMIAPEADNESSLPTPEIAIIEPEPSEPPVLEFLAPRAENSDSETSSFLTPVEELENSGDVETARLPQVDTPADAEPDTQGDESSLPIIIRPGSETEGADSSEQAALIEEADTSEDMEGREDLPALLRYAMAFDNPEGTPLVSIVLVNEGAALTSSQLDELPASIAFGVQAGAANAAQIAQQYREAGREVVMIPALPSLATPQDVEQALRVNFETVPEAVAVMDVTGGSFQSDREAINQVVDVVAGSGHGLITFPRGLNAAHQRATRAGVATGLIFRQLDADGETAAQIQRTLDRAAFRARQDEAVILVGTTNPVTLIALVEWVLGNRAESVTLAPISAALVGGG